MQPPTVPQLPHMFARRFFVDIEIRRRQETGAAEEQPFTLPEVFTQEPKRESLCQERERELVFLVTERAGDLLKKRLIASVRVDLGSNPIRFSS